MARKIVMRCSTPVMNADGSVRHQPGDIRPDGHKDVADSPAGSWYEVIVGDESEPAVVEEPKVLTDKGSVEEVQF